MCGVQGRAVLDRMKTPSKRMTSVSPLNPTLNHLVKHQAPGKGRVIWPQHRAISLALQLNCLALQFQPLRSLLDPANLLFAGSSPPLFHPFPSPSSQLTSPEPQGAPGSFHSAELSLPTPLCNPTSTLVYPKPLKVSAE